LAGVHLMRCLYLCVFTHNTLVLGGSLTRRPYVVLGQGT